MVIEQDALPTFTDDEEPSILKAVTLKISTDVPRARLHSGRERERHCILPLQTQEKKKLLGVRVQAHPGNDEDTGCVPPSPH